MNGRGHWRALTCDIDTGVSPMMTLDAGQQQQQQQRQQEQNIRLPSQCLHYHCVNYVMLLTSIPDPAGKFLFPLYVRKFITFLHHPMV